MSIVYRYVLGRPLTIAEADGNFQYIETELTNKLDSSDYTAEEILTRLLTVDGAASGLDADLLDGKQSASTNTSNTIVARDSSGNFSANIITSNLVGNVTGNLTGNVTGNVSGTSSTITGILAIENGGTGAATVGDARTALGLNSMALQNSAAVNISGGSITNIVDLAIADGGTGASTAALARVNLGVNIGTDVQGFSPILSSLSSISTNGIIVKNGSGTLISRSITGTGGITVVNGDAVSGNVVVSIGNSVQLTGIPTAPTAPLGTDNTQLATTEFVQNSIDDFAETFSSGGTTTAWVIFDGITGAIATSKNVNSVTILSAGVYRINIASGTFQNGNFIAAGMASEEDHFLAFVNSTATTLTVNSVDSASSNNSTDANEGPIRVIMFS